MPGADDDLDDFLGTMDLEPKEAPQDFTVVATTESGVKNLEDLKERLPDMAGLSFF